MVCLIYEIFRLQLLLFLIGLVHYRRPRAQLEISKTRTMVRNVFVLTYIFFQEALNEFFTINILYNNIWFFKESPMKDAHVCTNKQVSNSKFLHFSKCLEIIQTHLVCVRVYLTIESAVHIKLRRTFVYTICKILYSISNFDV